MQEEEAREKRQGSKHCKMLLVWVPTAYSNTVHKTTKVRRPRETGKQNMKRMCRILFNLKWGTKSDIYYRRDRTWGHSAKANDHIRRQMLHGSADRRNLYSRGRKHNSGWEFGEETWEVVEMDSGGCTRQASFTSETYCKKNGTVVNVKSVLPCLKRTFSLPRYKNHHDFCKGKLAALFVSYSSTQKRSQRQATLPLCCWSSLYLSSAWLQTVHV